MSCDTHVILLSCLLALTDQATKTHETLSDMLIFADSKHGPVDIDPHLLYYPPDGHRGHDSFN